MTPLFLFLSTLAQTFVASPYLQLGQHPAPDRLSVVWHAPDEEANWWLEHKTGHTPWIPAVRVQNRRVLLRDTKPFRIYEAELDQLTPGAEFDYRVTRNGAPVFTARGKAIAAPNASVRFALLGDTGQGTRGQKRTIYQMHRAQPDAAVVTGDLVYPSGRLKHYTEHWFPFFNAGEASSETGAPFTRARLTAAVPGNHDFEECLHLGAKPDCLAYFHVWSQPINGPGNHIPVKGPTVDVSAFKQLAGPRFPQGASFSFDYGPVHWTMLDSNNFMDWTTPALRDWLERDLAAAHTPWKFVVLHHAPFHSSRKHAEQQRLRVLAPLFEKHGVAIVFSGHVHNYQRTHAIRFTPDAQISHPLGNRDRIPGKAVRDPKGVIYLLTGAGGAGLHDDDLTGRPAAWQAFTAKLEARRHSFTQLDVTPQRVTLRQISEDGNELDFLELARE